MSLERKDCRFKLDADIHAMLKTICETDEVDFGDFVEALVVPAVRKRVHDAMVLAKALQRLGITGIDREQPGNTGNGKS